LRLNEPRSNTYQPIATKNPHHERDIQVIGSNLRYAKLFGKRLLLRVKGYFSTRICLLCDFGLRSAAFSSAVPFPA
jgi:hypothetical protein